MRFLSFVFPWGLILQALALVHFLRRRPDTIWLWIIIFFGPHGALVYIVMEVAPDAGLLRQSLNAVGRRAKIRELEALVVANPASGNYEELAGRHRSHLPPRHRRAASGRLRGGPARSRRGHGTRCEVREWAERVLATRRAMPRYLERRERPSFRKAKALLNSLPRT